MDDMKQIRTPPVIRLEWLQGDFRRVLQSACGQWLVTYDPTTRAGGVYAHEAGLWAIYGPMGLAEFAGSLKARGVALPDGGDLQHWLDAVTGIDDLPHVGGIQ